MEFAFLVFEPAFLVLEPDMEQTPSVLVLTSSFLQHLRKHDRGSWPSISTNCSTHRLSLSISRVRVMATYKMYCLYASMHIRLSASCCTCLSCLALRCSDCCHSCPPRHLRSLFSSSYQYGRRALLRGRPAVVGTPAD